MTRIRMHPADRRELILKVAVRLASKIGIDSINRVNVAKAAGITEGLINKYFGGIEQLRTEVTKWL